MQLLKTGSAVLAAMALCAGAGQAATVTATFAGNTYFGSGPFLGTAGTAHTLEIVGRSDTPGMAATSIPEFFTIGGGSATAYSLSSMTYALPDEGRSFTSNSVTAYVGNNVAREITGDIVDGIAIFGSAGTTDLRYFAEFSATTWDDDSTQEAIVAALTTAFTQGRGAGASQPGGSTFGLIDIIDVTVVEDPTPPPPNPTPTPTPTPAPIPLPASIPLLLAGLGSLGYLRFKR